MADPNVFDFSAEDEDTITIIFPGGKHSTELPTMDELNMETFQWLAANGEEWQRLFTKANLSVKERQRFTHLNKHLCYALCEGVPREIVDRLTDKRKAKVIVGFMTASPGLLELAKEIAGQTDGAQPSAKPKTSRARSRA
ncbi:MAG: hypothetical protein ACRDNE_00660 [Gaiellaceae bacterium]